MELTFFNNSNLGSYKCCTERDIKDYYKNKLKDYPTINIHHMYTMKVVLYASDIF